MNYIHDEISLDCDCGKEGCNISLSTFEYMHIGLAKLIIVGHGNPDIFLNDNSLQKLIDSLQSLQIRIKKYRGDTNG